MAKKVVAEIRLQLPAGAAAPPRSNSSSGRSNATTAS